MSEQMYTLDEAASILNIDKPLVDLFCTIFNTRPLDLPGHGGKGIKRIDMRRVVEQRGDQLLVSWSGLLVLTQCLGKPEAIGRLIAMVMPSMPQEVLDFLELAGSYTEEFQKDELTAARSKALSMFDEDEDEDKDGWLCRSKLIGERDDKEDGSQ